LSMGAPRMSDSTRLGGFKVLKNVVRISLFPPRELADFPLRLCRLLAENRDRKSVV